MLGAVFSASHPWQSSTFIFPSPVPAIASITSLFFPPCLIPVSQGTLNLQMGEQDVDLKVFTFISMQVEHPPLLFADKFSVLCYVPLRHIRRWFFYCLHVPL